MPNLFTEPSRARWVFTVIVVAVLAVLTVNALPSSANTAAAVNVNGLICNQTMHDNGVGFTLVCDPPVAPTPSPTLSPTASPTPSATPTPSPTPTPTTPPAQVFPTETTAGVPAGWVPDVTRSGWTIDRPGVYENVRVNGDINVRASNVTLRRVEVIGGVIDNEESSFCFNGLVLEDVTVRNSVASNGAVTPGGYTANRVALVDVGEGFRFGGRSDAGCFDTFVSNSYVRLRKPASVSCGNWHGDAIQGFDAPRATVTNTTLDARHRMDCSTAGVFYGNAEANGNAPLTVRRLLIFGGIAYRPDTPHNTEGLRIVEGTTTDYLGGDFTCERATRWVDNGLSTPTGELTRLLTC